MRNLIKVRKLIIFGLTLPILAYNCLPVVAQSKQKISSLPNGNYFYGTSRSPYKSGTDYLIFRKTGNIITGMKYPVPGETTCFRGNASSNTINNVTIRLQELGEGSSSGEFVRRNPINLNSYYRLRFDQVPDFAKRGLRECITVFSNRS